MRTTFSPFITAATFGVLISARSFAIEPPADNSPPVPVAEEQEAEKPLPEFKLKVEEKPAAQDKVAFIGIISGDLPEMLADHLDMKPGDGVIVRSLVPNGPAAAAGLTVNDVVTHVGGEPVGSPQILSNRIAALQPGETVSVELIHKGKPSKLDVLLGDRPPEMAGRAQQLLDPQMELDGLPKELADRIREALAGNIGRMDLQLGQGNGLLEEAMRELQLRMQGAVEDDGRLPNGAGDGEIHGGAKVQLKDPEGSVEVVSNNGGKEVTVRDLNGNVTWSGPWDTAQDKAAAPEAVRLRVDSLNLDADFKGQGLRLQMKPPAEPGN